MWLFAPLYIMNYVRLKYQTTFNLTQSRSGLKRDLSATDVSLTTSFISHMCGTFSAMSPLKPFTKWIKTGDGMFLCWIHPYSTWHGLQLFFFFFFNEHVEKVHLTAADEALLSGAPALLALLKLDHKDPCEGVFQSAISAQTHSRHHPFLR